MSRIGTQTIKVPAGVTVDIQGKIVTVKGPKGTLDYTMPAGISANVDDNVLCVKRDSDEQQARAFHGLVRSLLNNMVEGVSKGFEKRLEIQGVGYRAQATGNKINLSLGFSHPVEMSAPEGVTVNMDAEEKNIIVVSGYDKQAVGEFAANIRKLRKPEPYKGKGIRYLGERVVRKAGKAASK
jgi:large subunit ribosomal protein L6